jgi:hypothetical protein
MRGIEGDIKIHRLGEDGAREEGLTHAVTFFPYADDGGGSFTPHKVVGNDQLSRLLQAALGKSAEDVEHTVQEARQGTAAVGHVWLTNDQRNSLGL